MSKVMPIDVAKLPPGPWKWDHDWLQAADGIAIAAACDDEWLEGPLPDSLRLIRAAPELLAEVLAAREHDTAIQLIVACEHDECGMLPGVAEAHAMADEAKEALTAARAATDAAGVV